MGFKTILVNLNHESRVAELVAAAAGAARPTEAHVVGLYVAPPLFMPSDVIMPMGADFYEQQVSEHREQSERIRTVFDRLTKGEPFVAEWKSKGNLAMAYEPIAGGVIAEARAADLVVVSQATAADVAASLARHGLKVDVEAMPQISGSIGPALLASATAAGADLLVMGAYGHSRMREFILGGATRDVLKSMTVPVLMSH